jgi:hypothetical protein
VQELLNTSGGDNCDNETDLAVLPGGSEFVVACGWPYAHYYYSTTDLSLLGHYVSNIYPTAVAIDPGSGLLALGTGNQYTPRSICTSSAAALRCTNTALAAIPA